MDAFENISSKKKNVGRVRERVNFSRHCWAQSRISSVHSVVESRFSRIRENKGSMLARLYCHSILHLCKSKYTIVACENALQTVLSLTFINAKVIGSEKIIIKNLQIRKL